MYIVTFDRRLGKLCCEKGDWLVHLDEQERMRVRGKLIVVKGTWEFISGFLLARILNLV